MKIIAKNNSQKKGFFNLYIESNYICEIPEFIYMKYSLYESKDMPEKEVENLLWQIQFSYARSIGIHYMSRGLKSIHEARMRLKEENFKSEVIESAIEEFIKLGYLNDHNYTQRYISTKLKTSKKSKAALVKALKDKGIEECIIEEELNNAIYDEYEVGKELIERKFGEDFLEKFKKEKIMTFLKNRGFEFSTIRKIIKKHD